MQAGARPCTVTVGGHRIPRLAWLGIWLEVYTVDGTSEYMLITIINQNKCQGGSLHESAPMK